MSFNRSISDTALVPNNVPSFLDLLARIDAAESLTPLRRRDLRSAVHRVAAALDRPLADCPAYPPWLQPRLARIEPAALGISRKTWNTCVSNLRAAFRSTKLLTGKMAPRVRLSPVWLDLRDRLTSNRQRIGLARLLQYCSDTGISPRDVDDGVFQDFAALLVASEIRKKPHALLRDVAMIWNEAATTIEGWPENRITPPDRCNRVRLDPDSFPDSFCDDVAAFLSRLAAEDLCDLDAPPCPIAPATIALREGQIWRFASALVHQGRSPETILSLADLVAHDAALEGLRYFLSRNGGKSSGSIANYVSLLKSIARWHLHVDEQTLSEFCALGKRLKPRAEGLTAKNRHRLRQFDDPAAVHGLLRLPWQLAARADRAGQTVAAARDMEMALALSILIYCPMRIKNLRMLDLDRHVTGRGATRRIVIPAEEVKNGRELDFPLPAALCALLDTFVVRYRKLLNPAPGRLLFPQRCAAKPVGGGALGAAMSRTIRRETGLEVNPHLFRHLMAKLFLDSNPGAYEVVRRLLGHSKTSSTLDCYAGFETDAATREYAQVIEALEENPTPQRQGRRKRSRRDRP